MAINKDELTLLSPLALISISVSQSSSFSLRFIDPPVLKSHPPISRVFPLTFSFFSPTLPFCLPSVKSSCLPSIPLTSLFSFNFSLPDTAVHHVLGSGRRASLWRPHSSGLWKAEITHSSPPLAAATYCAIHHTWRMINTSPSPLLSPSRSSHPHHPSLLLLYCTLYFSDDLLSAAWVYARKLNLLALSETRSKARVTDKFSLMWKFNLITAFFGGNSLTSYYHEHSSSNFALQLSIW